MKVTLHYYGQLRQLANCESEEVEFDKPSALAELLRRVSGKYDPAFSKILFNARQQPSSSVMLLINQEPAPRDSSPVVRDGDEVSLIPAIAGG